MIKKSKRAGWRRTCQVSILILAVLVDACMHQLFLYAVFASRKICFEFEYDFYCPF